LFPLLYFLPRKQSVILGIRLAEPRPGTPQTVQEAVALAYIYEPMPEPPIKPR
jgi:hypothetical protein